MAILPDITAIDVGAVSADFTNFLPAMKDYFDPTVDQTDVQQGNSAIDSIRQNNRSSTGASVGPAQSPNFELVTGNNNDGQNFTITPKDANENWHHNLEYGDGNPSPLEGFVDPQGNIDDAINGTVGSSGPPEESPSAPVGVSGLNGDDNSTTIYVLEYVDAIQFLFPNANETALTGYGQLGKLINPYIPSVSQGFLMLQSQNNIKYTWTPADDDSNTWGAVQLGLDNWQKNAFSRRASCSFENGWYSGQKMAINSGSVGVNTPDGGSRTIGYYKYTFRVTGGGSETPGLVLNGGSKTDFAFVGEDSDSTYEDVIPWDANLTPIWQ